MVQNEVTYIKGIIIAGEEHKVLCLEAIDVGTNITGLCRGRYKLVG